ncbi:MAG: biotin/lipoyl-containing protein, partial [Chloroflexota bacterium]
MAKVTMPQLGESVAEGTIGRWLKQPGDAVAKYEPLLEVITDKVNAEVPSPYAGILREILAPEGAVVPNNAEIAVIETDAEAGAGAGADTGTGSGASPVTAAPALVASEAVAVTPPPVVAPEAAVLEVTAPEAARSAGDLLAAHDPNARMTPAVRRLLREHGLEATQVPGTGGGGRITREDVVAQVAYIRSGGPVPSAATPPAGMTLGVAPATGSAPATAPATLATSPAAAPA